MYSNQTINTERSIAGAALLVTAVLLAASTASAQSSIVGALGNFDAANYEGQPVYWDGNSNRGHTAYGSLSGMVRE